MHFDWTISLGTVITSISFAGALWVAAAKLYSALDRRMVRFEGILTTHATTLVDHSRRMEKQDDILLRLIGDVQRLVGRLEVGRGEEARTERN